MSEWYEAHEVNHPYFWGTVTILAAEVGNEALESSNERDIGAHDHIADLYFFDTAAKVLFANDRVAKFMVDELQLTVWNFRPMYFPKDRHIHNAGTNYICRPKSLSTEKTSPFIHMGMMPMVGVSRRLPEQFRLSVGMGPSYRNPLTSEGMLGGGFVENHDDLTAQSILTNDTTACGPTHSQVFLVSTANTLLIYWAERNNARPSGWILISLLDSWPKFKT